MTGVLCSAVNSLRQEERKASKHEIREEAVMQPSAPTALGGAPRRVTGQKTATQGLPHHTTPPLSFGHTILQLRTAYELFVSMSLLLLLVARKAPLLYLCILAFHVQYNTLKPNASM